MLGQIVHSIEGLGVSPATVMIFGIASGVLLVVWGLASAFAGPDPSARRISEAGRRRSSDRAAVTVVRPGAEKPKGLLKALVPSDQQELTRVERQLAQAGLTGRNAVRNYYLLRVVLGFVLPALLVGGLYMLRSGIIDLPESIVARFDGMTGITMMKILALLIGAGFFGPAMWLKNRVAARQRRIEEAFPNTLDLIQISLEAGLGFDAALRRVSIEIARAAPELSDELTSVYNELRSGRPRDRALLDMAARTGVDEVRSFASVVLQSVQFGTSMSSALTSYAREMRIARETRAQELANKLPVKMSLVMSALMLPALIMLTIGPSIIRFMQFFPN